MPQLLTTAKRTLDLGTAGKSLSSAFIRLWVELLGFRSELRASLSKWPFWLQKYCFPQPKAVLLLFGHFAGRLYLSYSTNLKYAWPLTWLDRSVERDFRYDPARYQFTGTGTRVAPHDEE